MYQSQKIYVKPDMKMSTLINENPSLLLMLDFFEVDFAVGDKTIEKICNENNIKINVFLIICNLYNGFYPNKSDIKASEMDILQIIKFLKNSHRYYKKDQYPEVKSYIQQLYINQNKTDIGRIENFFNEYFEEVVAHLRYEDEIAFPYFSQLINDKCNSVSTGFSVNEYREHHSDIETKLSDLKTLLLKHISLKNDFTLRRKMLYSLFDLERDLYIHSAIEEMVLLPLVDEIETRTANG